MDLNLFYLVRLDLHLHLHFPTDIHSDLDLLKPQQQFASVWFCSYQMLLI